MEMLFFSPLNTPLRGAKLLFIVAWVLGCTRTLYAQDSRGDWITQYVQVSDAVFKSEARPRNSLARVVIRYQPSFSPESQLVLTFTKENESATYTSLTEPLTQTIQREGRSVRGSNEIAAKVRIQSSSRNFPQHTARVDLGNLWDALAKSPKILKNRLGGIAVDRTNYQISIEADDFSIIYDVSDAELRPDRITGSAEIVRWANRMRLRMAK